jgi:hypothetical protein
VQDEGAANPSFAYTLLKKYDENLEKGMPNHFSMQDIQGASGSVFIAGSNTVRRPVNSLLPDRVTLTAHRRLPLRRLRC